ncbi:periodic tryptophan protein 1 homolog [Prorops nasuta]|uniref:periodic tryptophan protein 1 homolog n=1 Tax=Prorops nasuta TaxID=863751 RepID=UPI0034CD6081
MNVITCTTWVRRGVSASHPEKIKLTQREIMEIVEDRKKNAEDTDDSKDDSPKDCTSNRTKDHVKRSSSSEISAEDEYNFSKYDDESTNINYTIGDVVSFNDKDNKPLMEQDDEDSDDEDDIIKQDDNLVLLGHVEGDFSMLEVFVYNEKEGSFYCHHDLLLPSFPLCIEWLNFDAEDAKPGNFCAIGNMTPIIEIWDLDLIDCLEPAFKLGAKGNKKKNTKRSGHRDAVLDVVWNQNYVHILASGSVDQTTLLWDMECLKPVTKFDSFNEKVQSLAWNPSNAHYLLTGCADKMIRLFDCKDESMTQCIKIQGEVEKVAWNHFNTNYFLASTNNGYIEYMDIRKNKPIWQICGHQKEVTGLSLSSSYKDMLITTSNDGNIKVWDISTETEPALVWQKKTNLGAIQCLASNPDNPLILAVGGDNKAHNFKVMDLSEIPEVSEIFKERNSFVK